jgi:hypothetical protein
MMLTGPLRHQRDLDILSGKPTRELAHKYGMDPGAIRQRRSRLLRANGKSNGNGGNGHGTPAPSAPQNGALVPVQGGEIALAREVTDPSARLDIEAELGRIFSDYKAFEDRLKTEGAPAIPIVLGIMAQRRATLESLLKARELGAALSNAQEPEDWRAEVGAYLDKVMARLPPEAKDALLKAASEVEP